MIPPAASLAAETIVAAAPTRAAALARLAVFAPKAGRAYANHRNEDTGPGIRSNVSQLSPYVRHRLITEAEVVTSVLAHHTPHAAEKFIQEVCWRTYWKGWLEMRPDVWHNYTREVTRLRAAAAKDGDLSRRLQAAESGTTGIACYDAWVEELVETGYLHNHTRMWFASIWVYTLRLPWQLGADVFMRHLYDGDPASNTLSWRWVCGLQTAGKTYLARPDNIERYTAGRFAPYGELATEAPPLTDPFDTPKMTKIGAAGHVGADQPCALIVSEDDLAPESWPLPKTSVAAVIGLRTADADPGVSAHVIAFRQAALADAIARAQATFSCPVLVQPASTAASTDHIMAFASKAGAEGFVTMDAPVGPTADAVRPHLAAIGRAGWPVTKLRRAWDDLFWPHATHGFFRLKEKIPSIIDRLALDRQPELPLG